jgi:hypothetical protein
MTSTPSCPPRSVWLRIVEEGFAESAMGDLGAHLDGCSVCQAAVESLTAGVRSYRAISAELRQELPPAPPVCQRILEDLKENPAWPVRPGALTAGSQADEETSAKLVFCPHCLEMVRLEGAIGCSPARCPLCWRAVEAIGGEAALPDYEVSKRLEDQPNPKEIQEYVVSLEKRARKDLAQEPYRRGRFPVEFVAGVILAAGGLLVLTTAFTSEGGLMSSLVNHILPAAILMLMAAICFVFWAK